MIKITKLSTENVVAACFFLFLSFYPLWGARFAVDTFSGYIIAVLLTFSVALIWNYCGIFSFGQAAFYGVGAYAYGILCSALGGGNTTLIAALIGVILGGLFALFIGYFIFYGRVSDFFIGIITLCITLALQSFMFQTAGSQWKIAGVALGGQNGIVNIPPLSIGSISFSEYRLMYYLVMFVILAIFLALRWIAISNLGYAMFGIRENKERSSMFGYNTALIQTLVFGAGGAIAAIAGVLFASWNNYIEPTRFAVATSTIAIAMVIAGGKKSLTGAMILTVLYSLFAQYLSTQGNPYSTIILGLFIILSILLIPEGLMHTLFSAIDKLCSRFFCKTHTQGGAGK